MSAFAPENDLLLRALSAKPVPRTPVWVMRQAGRYLPEYRKLRAEAGSFMSLATNPELACEVTLQPLRRFKLDAAILFSDILTIPDAMGLGLYFEEGEGPRFRQPLASERDIRQLPLPDPERELSYVTDAVRLIRQRLDNRLPLIGFSGSPWTLATYMLEGGSSRTFAKSKKLLLESASVAHHLLGKLADAVTDYLNAQIAAGAQAVQIFDTWGGALPYAQYREFSLAYMQRIVDGLNRSDAGTHVPVILFSKGCSIHYAAMAETGCDAIGVDWTCSLAQARDLTGDRVALQGNLDPATLLAGPEAIRAAVQQTLASYGDGHGHVFNLGHGITPDVPPEHLGVLIDAVRDFSPGYKTENPA